MPLVDLFDAVCGLSDLLSGSGLTEPEKCHCSLMVVHNQVVPSNISVVCTRCCFDLGQLSSYGSLKCFIEGLTDKFRQI